MFCAETDSLTRGGRIALEGCLALPGSKAVQSGRFSRQAVLRALRDDNALAARNVDAFGA
jgi:hypothetical protein